MNIYSNMDSRTSNIGSNPRSLQNTNMEDLHTVLCPYKETTDVTKPPVHYISWKPLNKGLRTVGLIPQGHSEISEGAHRQVNGYKGLVTAGLLL